MSEQMLTWDAGRADDREVFAGIVRRYQNLVTALTFSMTGNLQQSEDLAQETFVAAWRNLTGSESRADVAAEKMGPWLCGIARNLTNNWLRRTTRERQTPHIPADADAVADLSADVPIGTGSGDDESELTREMQADLVWDTLRHIPATYREPLTMFYRQDASVREIADALGLTEACVKQRISRGRTMLKGEIASRSSPSSRTSGPASISPLRCWPRFRFWPPANRRWPPAQLESRRQKRPPPAGADIP